MWGLHVAVAECNYRRLDRQLKEQFIYGLNDKCMLDEIIRELTAKNNDEQLTSEGVLVWAQRIEEQRAQDVVVNNITEPCQFDQVKVAKKLKENNIKLTPGMTGQLCPCRYCGRIHTPQQCSAYGKMCAGCSKTGHFKKMCQSRRDRAEHELEVEMAQEIKEGEIETVSID